MRAMASAQDWGSFPVGLPLRMSKEHRSSPFALNIVRVRPDPPSRLLTYQQPRERDHVLSSLGYDIRAPSSTAKGRGRQSITAISVAKTMQNVETRSTNGKVSGNHEDASHNFNAVKRLGYEVPHGGGVHGACG